MCHRRKNRRLPRPVPLAVTREGRHLISHIRVSPRDDTGTEAREKRTGNFGIDFFPVARSSILPILAQAKLLFSYAGMWILFDTFGANVVDTLYVFKIIEF